MKKRNNNRSGGGIGVLLILALASAYRCVTANSDKALLVAFVAFELIILIVVVKSVKRRRYWTRYYNRDRGLAEIGASGWLLVSETNDALNGVQRNIEGCGRAEYVGLREAIEKAYSSNEVAYLDSDNNYTAKHMNDNYEGDMLLSSVGVVADDRVINIYCELSKDGGYHFVILPRAVYVFITGKKKYTFVGAYGLELLSLSIDYIGYDKKYTHIDDMSHQPNGYFLRYCDIRDSKAISAGWEHETVDGYRDGRRQGNNSFLVTFKYVKATYNWGDLSVITVFSNTSAGTQLRDTTKALKGASKKWNLPAKAEGETEDDILALVKDQQSSAGDSASTEEDILDRRKTSCISCEDARSRNRYIVKAIQSELTSLFGSELDFKTYQVRRDYDDWKLQDAEVFAYIDRGNAKFCMEYILRTTLETGTTFFEYKISCEDGANLVLQYFSETIKKYGMEEYRNSYRKVFDRDLQSLSGDATVAKIVPEIRQFIEEVVR